MRLGKAAATLSACVGAAALLALAAGGCTGYGGYDGAPPYTGPVGVGGGANCVSAMPSKNPQIIFEFVSGPHCNDSTYGDVDGYFFDTTFKHFEVIQVTRSASNTIVFQNVDGQDHMTSSLGTWNGSWPANGPSASATPSPQGADIGSAGWTTGIIAPGGESRAYIANIPGLYMVGDPFFYTSNNMRTILIVQ